MTAVILSYMVCLFRLLKLMLSNEKYLAWVAEGNTQIIAAD